jgi:hypothetical protein
MLCSGRRRQELRDADAQRGRKGVESGERDVALRALDSADVGSMEAARVGEGFLRQPKACAVRAHIRGKNDTEVDAAAGRGFDAASGGAARSRHGRQFVRDATYESTDYE